MTCRSPRKQLDVARPLSPHVLRHSRGTRPPVVKFLNIPPTLIPQKWTNSLLELVTS